jgi:hypothetical protein
MLSAKICGIPVTLEKTEEDEWLMIGRTWIGDWTMRFLLFIKKHILNESPAITDIKERK